MHSFNQSLEEGEEEIKHKLWHLRMIEQNFFFQRIERCFNLLMISIISGTLLLRKIGNMGYLFRRILIASKEDRDLICILNAYLVVISRNWSIWNRIIARKNSNLSSLTIPIIIQRTVSLQRITIIFNKSSKKWRKHQKAWL